MISHIHTEVLLADAYAVLLVGVAVILELVARHSHHRSQRFRNGGFAYHPALDVWECPTGHHLKPEKNDLARQVTRYRAPAHQCNTCHLKKHCTDSEAGRLLESRPDGWLQSELNRFHRAISLALLLLAFIVLAAEMFRYRQRNDWMALLILLLPIGFVGSRYVVLFAEQNAKPKTNAIGP